MKKSTIQTMALAVAVVLLGLTGTSHLLADSTTTTTVRVNHHYEFHDGKYVWYPTYYAQAPASKDLYSVTRWRSPGYVQHETGYQPAHWSTDDRPTPGK